MSIIKQFDIPFGEDIGDHDKRPEADRLEEETESTEEHGETLPPEEEYRRRRREYAEKVYPGTGKQSEADKAAIRNIQERIRQNIREGKYQDDKSSEQSIDENDRENPWSDVNPPIMNDIIKKRQFGSRNRTRFLR